MNRRRFLAAGLAGLAAPRAAAQQPGKLRRIALLGSIYPAPQMTEARDRNLKAFFGELRRLGYREGDNLAVERRSAERDPRRFPDLAREIVSLGPEAVFTATNPAVAALKAATGSIPIVALLYDPVGAGFAASLARPGGNITGFTYEPGLELFGKSISILKETVPSATKIAYLTARLFWEDRFGAAWREAAQAQGLTAIGAAYDYPGDESELRRVFAVMARNGVELLDVSATPETYRHRQLVVDLAAEARLPAIYTFRENVEAGGLMAYGVDVADMFRRAAGYVGQILAGAKPGDLPIQQPTKFELVINLKTAKALGLAIPPALLVRADEVIE
jgi:putative ABC transport system substrate-binding protein